MATSTASMKMDRLYKQEYRYTGCEYTTAHTTSFTLCCLSPRITVACFDSHINKFCDLKNIGKPSLVSITDNTCNTTTLVYEAKNLSFFGHMDEFSAWMSRIPYVANAAYEQKEQEAKHEGANATQCDVKITVSHSDRLLNPTSNYLCIQEFTSFPKGTNMVTYIKNYNPEFAEPYIYEFCKTRNIVDGRPCLVSNVTMGSTTIHCYYVVADSEFWRYIQEFANGLSKVMDAVKC